MKPPRALTKNIQAFFSRWLERVELFYVATDVTKYRGMPAYQAISLITTVNTFDELYELLYYLTDGYSEMSLRRILYDCMNVDDFEKVFAEYGKLRVQDHRTKESRVYIRALVSWYTEHVNNIGGEEYMDILDL